MATLSKEDVQGIVRLYDRGAGDTVSALAEAYSVDDNTIRYHLKKHGVYGVDGPKRETDADLGIDEDEVAGDSAGALAALMGNPALQELIDAAVSARLAQMVAPQPQASTPTGDFKALADSLAHMIEVSQSQQPGYIKPLPAHEVDRRANAYIEMGALLKKHAADPVPPTYTLTADLFECRDAYTYKDGTKIGLLVAPPEACIPENESAKAIYAAMLTWIGGPTPDIGDQIEAAERESRLPIVGGDLRPKPATSGIVQVLAEPKLEPRRRKSLPPGVSEVAQHHAMPVV